MNINEIIEIYIPAFLNVLRKKDGDIIRINETKEHSLQIIKGDNDKFYFIFNSFNIIIPIDLVYYAHIDGSLFSIEPSEEQLKSKYFILDVLRIIFDAQPEHIILQLYCKVLEEDLRQYKDLYFHYQKTKSILKKELAF